LTWSVIADRGQGVLASLRRVLPGLQRDQYALDTAFSKIISGRSPEKRGNGLKFVREVVNGCTHRGLVFLSGTGEIGFGGMASAAKTSLAADRAETTVVPGTFALLWGGKP